MPLSLLELTHRAAVDMSLKFGFEFALDEVFDFLCSLS